MTPPVDVMSLATMLLVLVDSCSGWHWMGEIGGGCCCGCSPTVSNVGDTSKWLIALLDSCSSWWSEIGCSIGGDGDGVGLSLKVATLIRFYFTHPALTISLRIDGSTAPSSNPLQIMLCNRLAYVTIALNSAPDCTDAHLWINVEVSCVKVPFMPLNFPAVELFLFCCRDCNHRFE